MVQATLWEAEDGANTPALPLPAAQQECAERIYKVWEQMHYSGRPTCVLLAARAPTGAKVRNASSLHRLLTTHALLTLYPECMISFLIK